MTAASNYLEDELLDHVFNNAAFTSPTTVYAKLHTGDPGEDCTSNAAAETTRQSVSFAAASGGSISSDADTAWTSVSTTETYSHVSLWDASSGGNPLAYMALSSSVPVTAGGDFTIPSGSLTVTLA
jgi:hypothetical protein